MSKPRYRSETDKVRWLVLPFCDGHGLDVGYGGDKVCKSFLSMDLPEPYANTGDDPLDVAGDVLDGIPFDDDTFDVVYTSHLLEDFGPFPFMKAVGEMFRVLKNRGRLIIVVPDEQAYRAHCAATGQPHNFRHVHENMGLGWLKRYFVENRGWFQWRLLFESSCEVDYNVILVLEVDKVGTDSDRKDAEIQKLRAENGELQKTIEKLKAEMRGILRGQAGREDREAQGTGTGKHTMPGEDRY